MGCAEKKTVVLLLAVSLAAGCSLLPREEVEEAPVLLPPPEIRLVLHPVERGYVAEEIRGLGRVAAVRQAELYFRTGGRVREVRVEPNEQVHEDQILVVLETGDLEHQVRLAELNRQQMELRLERARHQVGRELTHLDLRILEIDLEKARLEEDRLRSRLEAATLRAAFDGVVTQVRPREGQTIEAYNPVAVLANPSQLQIQIEVSAADLNRVAGGQQARVQVRPREWHGALVRHVPPFGATLAPGQPDRRVSLELTDPAIPLTMGDLHEVVIVVREAHDALILPNSAIRDYMGRRFVRVLEGDVRREVDVALGIVGRTHTQIVSGLEEGQVVIGR